MRFLAVMFLALASMSSYAEEVLVSEPIEKQVQELLLNNKPAEAYNLASKNNELLGEPKFDFLLGLAALKVNKVHESVFAFERVIASAPNWHDARILLANAYLKANNIAASSAELAALKGEALNDVQLKKVAKLELEINTITASLDGALNNSVGLTFGQDSNINAGTSEDSIYIPSLNNDIPLSKASQELSGHYWRLAYNGSYKKKLSQQQGIRLSWGVNDFQYANEGQYNRTIANIAGEYRFKKESTTYIGKGSITPLLLKGDFYRAETEFSFGAEHKLNKQYLLSSSIGFGWLDNKEIESLDAELLKFNLGATYLGQQALHKVSVFYIDEESSLDIGKYNAKDTTGLSYQMIYAFNDSMFYLAMLSYQKQSFDDLHPLFLVKRKETLRQLTNTIQYKINKKLSVQGLLSYQNKSSNLSLYEYDRFDTALTLKYQF